LPTKKMGCTWIHHASANHLVCGSCRRLPTNMHFCDRFGCGGNIAPTTSPFATSCMAVWEYIISLWPYKIMDSSFHIFTKKKRHENQTFRPRIYMSRQHYDNTQKKLLVATISESCQER
jgi:hypothetical protein